MGPPSQGFELAHQLDLTEDDLAVIDVRTLPVLKRSASSNKCHASSNKCIASSNKCLTSSNKKLTRAARS